MGLCLTRLSLSLSLSPFSSSSPLRRRGVHSLFSGIGIQRYSVIHFFSSPTVQCMQCGVAVQRRKGRGEKGIMFHLFSAQDKYDEEAAL